MSFNSRHLGLFISTLFHAGALTVFAVLPINQTQRPRETSVIEFSTENLRSKSVSTSHRKNDSLAKRGSRDKTTKQTHKMTSTDPIDRNQNSTDANTPSGSEKESVVQLGTGDHQHPYYRHIWTRMQQRTKRLNGLLDGSKDPITIAMLIAKNGAITELKLQGPHQIHPRVASNLIAELSQAVLDPIPQDLAKSTIWVSYRLVTRSL